LSAQKVAGAAPVPSGLKLSLNRRRRSNRALFRGTLSEKVVLSPGEIVNERLIPASAIDRFLQWKADAVIIDPNVVGKFADAGNSV
jgi:hypothetical protein